MNTVYRAGSEAPNHWFIGSNIGSVSFLIDCDVEETTADIQIWPLVPEGKALLLFTAETPGQPITVDDVPVKISLYPSQRKYWSSGPMRFNVGSWR